MLNVELFGFSANLGGVLPRDEAHLSSERYRQWHISHLAGVGPRSWTGS